MKISAPLKGFVTGLRGLLNFMKNDASERKSYQSRFENSRKAYNKQNPPSVRQHKLKRVFRRIFRSRLQVAARNLTIPIIVEQSSVTRHSFPTSDRDLLEVQAVQVLNSTIDIQHYLPFDDVDEELDCSIAMLPRDISFVDSGYGIDVLSYGEHLAPLANTYPEEGSFSNHDQNPIFLTGPPNDEQEVFFADFGEAMPADLIDVNFDGADSIRPMARYPRNDDGVPLSDRGVEQISPANVLEISETDDIPSAATQLPQKPSLTFVEEQDTYTFSFSSGGNGWVASSGPISPELSPMSVDFPILSSLPLEPELAPLHPQSHDSLPEDDPQAPKGPTTGTQLTLIRKEQTIDWSLLLPSELLQEIFLHVLPDRPSLTDWKLDTPWPHPGLGDALLNLRKVCRRWNDVILSPCVWNSNVVAWSVATSTKPDSRARLGCIESHSRWAHINPVDSISYEIGSDPMTTISDEIMGAANRSIANCRFAQIIMPERDIVGTDLVERYPDAIQDIPRLRVLSWVSPYYFDTTLPPRWRLPWASLRRAPWGQLTACFLNCPLTMEDCLFVLRNCSKLKTLELNRIFSSETTVNDNPGNSPMYGELSSLKVSSAVDINALVSSVRLPNLLNLQLELAIGGDDEPLQQLQRLNLPWGSLETLILKCAMTLQDAYELFQRCHSVVKLEWYWPDVEEALIPRLETSVPFIGLDNLRSLVITPTLSHHHIQSLLAILTEQILSLVTVTLPTLPRSIRDSPETLINLNTLTLTNLISARECLLIMGGPPKLQKLDVLVNNIDLGLPSSVNPKQLKYLTLRTPIKNLELLFHTMTIPSLTSFELLLEVNDHSPHHWAGDYRYGDRQQGLYSFFRRSGLATSAPLERLVLAGFDVEDLEAILDLVTSTNTEVQITDAAKHRNTSQAMLYY